MWLIYISTNHKGARKRLRGECLSISPILTGGVAIKFQYIARWLQVDYYVVCNAYNIIRCMQALDPRQ